MIPNLFDNRQDVLKYRIQMLSNASRPAFISISEGTQVSNKLKSLNIIHQYHFIVDIQKMKYDLEGASAGVYLLYDRLGRLLYIGQTQNPISRLKTHRKNKQWHTALFFEMCKSNIEYVEMYLITNLIPKQNRETRKLYESKLYCTAHKLNYICLQ